MEQLRPKVCLGCGKEYVPKAYRPRQRFHDAACKLRFHNQSKAEGAGAIKLVKAWIGTRHAKPGTREAAICKRARMELTQLATMLNRRDKAYGRRPAYEYVEKLARESDWFDRVRK